ncbi:helix-turn-helix domain containing protein [Paenibacillus polymyxa]|nr:helix-turn-helix domain containing protein [Paenibacillus polymyxa]
MSKKNEYNAIEKLAIIAEQYQVSYHQVYQWVKKYKEHGPDDLRSTKLSS